MSSFDLEYKAHPLQFHILVYEIQNEINKLLNSDAINYLETSERLILKNILEKDSSSETEIQNATKIIKKYNKFFRA